MRTNTHPGKGLTFTDRADYQHLFALVKTLDERRGSIRVSWSAHDGVVCNVKVPQRAFSITVRTPSIGMSIQGAHATLCALLKHEPH